MRKTHIAAAVLFGFTVILRAAAQDSGEAIDTARSSLTIHVGKGGVFSAAAHEHWVAAPVAKGRVNSQGATPGIRFSVQASKLKVKPEKGFSEKDRAEVQSNMQTKVLESSTYPQIAFQSTAVQSIRNDAWAVSGSLTLHGVTKPVAVKVTREKGGYAGSALIKQTDFGIEPIKIGGGLVKVKDQLEITFHVYTSTH